MDFMSGSSNKIEEGVLAFSLLGLAILDLLWKQLEYAVS